MTAAVLFLESGSRMHHRFWLAGAPVEVLFDRHTDGAVSAEAARLAEKLVALDCGLPPNAVRVATLAPSGRPVAFLANGGRPPQVSISHAGGLIGAAVSATGRVGLDIVDPRDAGPALDIFFTPEEKKVRANNPTLWRARVWAAKEAAYKAASLDAAFQPRRVAITGLGADRFSWLVRYPAGLVRGMGCWCAAGSLVVAVAIAAGPGSLEADGEAEAVRCREMSR